MLYRLQLLFLVAVFVIVSITGITLPYVGFHAFNFNIYSQIAHNYNTFGLLETKFAPVVSVTEGLPLKPEYYLHHPPLVSLVIALFFKLFGEHFWVGRLSVIVFSCGSMLFLYLIGVELKGKKFALLTLTVGTLLPASALFGRMIGQESLVLFFCVTSLYLLLRYLRSANKKYLYGLLLSIALGVLSDWPMTYFVASLFPFLMVQKRLKLYWSMVLTAAGVALAYLLYILLIQGSFSELTAAFFERSITAHDWYGWWFVRWMALLALRFVVYFNPVFVGLSAIACWMTVKHKLLFKFELPLLFSLGLFGLTHVMLYPSGSFGHPYWIYYFVPFVALSAAKALCYFPKYIVLLVVIISVAYLFKIERWKTGETRANVWRYELAEKVSQKVPQYERIGINSDSAMDFDVLTYKFQISTVQLKPQSLKNDLKFYAYSCPSTCDTTSEDLAYLLKKHSFEKSTASQGEVYIFDLGSHATESAKAVVKSDMPNRLSKEVEISDTTMFQKMYAYLINWLQAPQI